MKLALTTCALLVAACASDSTNSPADDCDGQAACGQLSVRWTVEQRTMPATCTSVHGDNVTVTATYQADGRSATFTAACTAGALLSPRLPLGPYALEITLSDTTRQAIATDTTTATLGVAGTITEATAKLDVTPRATPGGLFGSCSASTPCSDPTMTCLAVQGGGHMCAPTCTTDAACVTAALAYGQTQSVAQLAGCFDSLHSGTATCFAACIVDTDCALGAHCNHGGDLNGACLPD